MEEELVLNPQLISKRVPQEILNLLDLLNTTVDVVNNTNLPLTNPLVVANINWILIRSREIHETTKKWLDESFDFAL